MSLGQKRCVLGVEYYYEIDVRSLRLMLNARLCARYNFLFFLKSNPLVSVALRSPEVTETTLALIKLRRQYLENDERQELWLLLNRNRKS